jgi:methylenetetrahydrofolate dehydrogenase (NADP+)/methenyltetrahydrofolate cyclohydrolase
LRQQIKDEVALLTQQGIQPCLAVILVGDDPASCFYVANKEKDCAECGIRSIKYVLPAGTTEQELLALIARLNNDPAVHGILVQLPLPKGLSAAKVITAISPSKDVDAFHPENVGRVMQGKYTFAPCTPAGVMKLLEAYNIPVEGRECVVIGRSNIVGKPQAMLLLHANGTVTMCHSKTANLAEVTRRADILVCAVGIVNFVTADMVKPGAVVIDVGMNVNAEGKLTGDVDFPAVEKITSYITPAPGGVGPMTRAMLLENTLTAAKMAAQA